MKQNNHMYKSPKKMLRLLIFWMIILITMFYGGDHFHFPLKRSYKFANATERCIILEREVNETLLKLNAEIGMTTKTEEDILTDEIRGYIFEIEAFHKQFPIHQICELGFVNAQKPSVFLTATNRTFVKYIGIDLSHDKDSTSKNNSLVWLKKTFPDIDISVIKGDPFHMNSVTIETGLKCDIIHINNITHIAPHLLQSSLKLFLAKFASQQNLLLIDRCLLSIPPPSSSAVRYIISTGFVTYSDSSLMHYMAGDRELRNPKHGWCVGSYQNEQYSLPLTSRLKVTVVLMGYTTARVPNYNKILSYYSTVDQYIDKVLFIWNNPLIPAPELQYSSLVPVTYIKSIKNSMNNRFNVLQHLRTDPVLIIDDDVLLKEEGFAHMLNIWDSNRDKLIGIDHRSATWKGLYFEPDIRKSPGTIVIGKTMLFHRNYLRMYFSDEALVAFNEDRFCEDIAMSALINNYTSGNPIFLNDTGLNIRVTLDDHDNGLHKETVDWVEKRDDCVRFMEQHYNLNVLRYGYGDSIFLKKVYRYLFY